MLLEKKNAVIYGAGGAIDAAVVRAFACEGVRIFLTGHTMAPIEAVAEEITRAGGVAEVVCGLQKKHEEGVNNVQRYTRV